MIVKRYMEPTQFGDPRERAGADAERQLAHYLHRRFRDDPAVCVLHQLRIEDADQSEQDGSAGVCQIDHLVVHRWGFFLVESKSVTEAVQVGSDGDGGEEWSRTYRGEQIGIPSPIRQAGRQAEFLRTLLQNHRARLVGRRPLGVRTIARVLGRTEHRDFINAPMQLIVAISDGGRILRRDGWKTPQKPFRVFVKKADLVPEEIERELDRHRTGAELLRLKPVGEYGIWSMQVEEVPRVAKFLAGRHVDRLVASSKPVGRWDATAKQRRYGKQRERYPNAYETWSERDDRELLRSHEDGRDNAELARRFGRKPSTIKSRLRKLKEWQATGRDGR